MRASARDLIDDVLGGSAWDAGIGGAQRDKRVGCIDVGHDLGLWIERASKEWFICHDDGVVPHCSEPIANGTGELYEVGTLTTQEDDHPAVEHSFLLSPHCGRATQD